jgi:hypothetical protein
MIFVKKWNLIGESSMFFEKPCQVFTTGSKPKDKKNSFKKNYFCIWSKAKF